MGYRDLAITQSSGELAPGEEPLLKASEAARILNVSPKTVYKYGKIGVLIRVVINGCVRFRREDVQTLISNRRGL